MQIIKTNIYSRFIQSSHLIECFIRSKNDGNFLKIELKFITPATFAKI